MSTVDSVYGPLTPLAAEALRAAYTCAEREMYVPKAKFYQLMAEMPACIRFVDTELSEQGVVHLWLSETIIRPLDEDADAQSRSEP